MALLLELLFLLTASVAFFSSGVCVYFCNRYDSTLEAKFPAMIHDLSTRGTGNDPFKYLRRWKKAIKLGDDELTREAKKCCLLIYIAIAGVICLFLLGIMLSYVL